MRKTLLKYISFILLLALLGQNCAASLSVCFGAEPAAEFSLPAENENESGEKETLKSLEELTDRIPGSISLDALDYLASQTPNRGHERLLAASSDVLVPPPDQG